MITNIKKRKDYDYMSFMASRLSKKIEKNVGIYELKINGLGKVFEFEEEKEGKEYLEVIRFDKHDTRGAVLSDNEGEGLDIIDDKWESSDGSADERVARPTREVLLSEQPDAVSDRPEKSNKNRKSKKRD